MNYAKDHFKLRAAKAPISIGCDNVNLYAFQDGDGKQYVAKPLSLKQVEKFEEVTPTCSLANSEAQVLMDDLWLCGLRPSEGTGSAGSLKATQNHLEDLRRLVFKGFSDSQMKIR